MGGARLSRTANDDRSTCSSSTWQLRAAQCQPRHAESLRRKLLPHATIARHDQSPANGYGLPRRLVNWVASRPLTQRRRLRRVSGTALRLLVVTCSSVGSMGCCPSQRSRIRHPRIMPNAESVIAQRQTLALGFAPTYRHLPGGFQRPSRQYKELRYYCSSCFPRHAPSSMTQI